MAAYRFFSPQAPNERLVTREGICPRSFGTQEFLEVEPRVLRQLAAEALHDAAFFLRTSQLESWVRMLRDQESSENERFVISSLIRNAVIAAEGLLPLCQDTGTAIVIARRGERVMTGGEDERWLTEGIAETWARDYLRFSQMTAPTLFVETNSKTNLPAQIDIEFAPGATYEFLFMAKGGGSANKTILCQESPAILNAASFETFLRERLGALGVAACPPYHMAVVVGGLSPEQNLKTLKLATAGALDHLPLTGKDGQAFRDPEWEQKLMQLAAEQGSGAQFGGKWLAQSARVIRLPRHAASCPISMGVSCSAHRHLLGRITGEGAFLEKLDMDPGRFLTELKQVPELHPVHVDLDQPLETIKQTLAKQPVGSIVLLSGPLIVARDLAHARWYELLKSGKPLPEYVKRHPIFYAGPAKTPPGVPVGSLGPTTAQRMDSYLETFMAQGASHITIAKGPRAASVSASCKAHGGFYLATVGGAAALLAKEQVTESSVIDFPELGMEAVHRIVVRDLPACHIVNHLGQSLY